MIAELVINMFGNNEQGTRNDQRKNVIKAKKRFLFRWLRKT